MHITHGYPPLSSPFSIHASGKDCALALGHLVFPTLTWLHVHVESRDRGGEDMLLVIPYVVRNVSVLQDIEPLWSILIGNERRDTEILTWTTPDADVNIHGPAIMHQERYVTLCVFYVRCTWLR